MRLLVTPVILSFASAAVAAPQLSPPPVFPPSDTVDVIHGTRVADPYRALENGADPKVQAWADAENARTRAYLDALPGRAEVASRLTQLIQAKSPSDRNLAARGDRIFEIYDDPHQQQPSLATLDANADPASRRIVVDPNRIDAKGSVEIDWYVASPDGSKVAVSLSRNGSEDGTLYVYDVASGHEIGAPIPRVQYPTAGGSLAWAQDGSGFWYTGYPGDDAAESERHFNQAVYYHKLGGDAAHDPLVLGAKQGVPRTGEIFLDGSRGSRVALASVQLGDGGQWQHWVLSPDGGVQQIGGYADHVIGGAVLAADGTIYAVSRRDAPMGQVLRLAVPYTGGFANATVIVPAQKDAAIIDGGEFDTPLALSANHLFVNRVAGGPNEVTVYDPSGRDPEKLDLPPVAGVSEIDPLPGGGAVMDISTYLDPTYFVRWKDGQPSRTKLAQSSPYDFSDCEVRRIFATSKDGTKVPVSVILKKGSKLDGSHPLLLTGYGGFGISIPPSHLNSANWLWIHGGGIIAEANIRGGGEYGEAWHQQGMLLHKQNVFDDFAASANALIALGYTNHDKLALIGGSNGGLLMGAMITQHPALARAVVSLVGIYDMVRLETDPNGAFNTTEYGTVKNPAQFAAMYAYSPYHHVQKSTPYPAVLFTEGLNDGRVNPMQSRKFVTALQAATSSDHPILLRISERAGHGIGSSLSEQIGLQTDILMFLFDQIGIDAKSAAGS